MVRWCKHGLLDVQNKSDYGTNQEVLLPFDDLQPFYTLHLVATESQHGSHKNLKFPENKKKIKKDCDMVTGNTVPYPSATFHLQLFKLKQSDVLFCSAYMVLFSYIILQKLKKYYTNRNIIWIHRFHRIQELKLNGLVGWRMLKSKI